MYAGLWFFLNFFPFLNKPISLPQNLKFHNFFFMVTICFYLLYFFFEYSSYPSSSFIIFFILVIFFFVYDFIFLYSFLLSAFLRIFLGFFLVFYSSSFHFTQWIFYVCHIFSLKPTILKQLLSYNSICICKS